jgi:sugar-specific transcriptional regulator TrmB
METEIFRKIGLSEGEIKVFTALLDSGASPMNRIHEKTGIERRNIYDILNKLIERGLVSYVAENGRRVFHAGHPSKILGYIEEKKDNLDMIRKELEKELPSMIAKFDSRTSSINSEIYRGEEGVKAVWEDMLNYKEVRWIGSGRYVPRMLPDFFAGWNKRRIKLGVKWFNLMRHEMKGKTKTMPLEKNRFLPEEFSGNPAFVCIYGNKTVNFIAGQEFFAFVIESREIAENYRRYHKYLWEKVAKP